MGGSHPSEYNGCNCGVCGIRLPPTKDWDGFYDTVIDRTVDKIHVYVFLGGKYYRPVGVGCYYCPRCFWKPRDDYYQRLAEENRRREEQRRREEEERLRREEERRRYEEHVRQENLRRQEEARKERERQEQIKREQERREAERIKRQQEQQEFEEKMTKKEAISDKFVAWTLNKERKEHRRVQAETYHDVSAVPHGDVQFEHEETIEQEYEVWVEGEEEGETYEGKFFEVTQNIITKVLKMVVKYEEGEEIDVEWLKIAQTQLVVNYAHMHGFSEMEVEILTYCVSQLRYDLSDYEILILTKLFCLIAQTHPMDYKLTRSTLDDELQGRFMIMLLITAFNNGHVYSECANKCVRVLVANAIKDKELVTLIMESRSTFWSAFDRFMFLQRCNEMKVSYTDQKRIMVLVQAYDISPITVERAMAKGAIDDVIKALVEYVDDEPNTHLVDLLKQIRSSELVEAETLAPVSDITHKTKKILESFNIHLDYQQRLTSDLENAKSIFKQCTKGSTLDHDKLAEALTTLCCVVKKSQGYCPRDTQLITLTILLVSDNRSISRLLEVMTGEGKSTVISMFAGILAIQGKHIDVITSSPILAVRDAEEWESFYTILGLTATHNTDIGMQNHSNPDETRKRAYMKPIVYGTVGNFAADILREEFEQKDIRSGRKFDAVIADEVDLLMLDEGVQFTYLSHDSPILHHLQPVIATVWAVIGQYKPIITSAGHGMYMGGAKLFSDIIFESINAEVCQVDDSSQFLIIANQEGLINEETVDKLMSDDEQTKQGKMSESKREAMSTISSDTVIALLPKLEEYLPYNFEAFTVNDSGLPESRYSSEITEAEAKLSEDERLPLIRLLLFDNGLACTLNNEDELKEASTAKIEASIEFSNDPDSTTTGSDNEKPKLKVPLFLKDLVLNQLPEYISSAYRCLEMVENREYTISKENKIIPVDFLNSGVMQLNKKWGQGLQQMLEMKHNLCVSSMSVVTNFMSHVELFTRYKENGAIYGLSGTLGVDSPETATLLLNLFKVHPCTIPTFKHRKLFENPAIIVDGSKVEWYKKIMEVINTAVKEETWRKGRAVLILCEDIKTAIDLREYVLKQDNWSEDKVHLYARSDSNELSAIKHKFVVGEVVIATNLAGRGTNIKVIDDVNKSGGLLCLVTFLPRNRRVELQAFGRTARKGKPGSVQCVLHASSLAPQYRDYIVITDIRDIRARNEQERLDKLLKKDVKEVQVKEKLFKAHCKYLNGKYNAIVHRKDKSITVDSINESWGQWLLMKSNDIQMMLEDKLSTELTEAQSKWPLINFYHEIKYGNSLLVDDEEDNAGAAHVYFTKAIKLESSHAAIAHYNRAYVTILKSDDGYMDAAIADLKAAEDCLEPYISEVASVLQCVSAITRIQHRDTVSDEKQIDYCSEQMQVRMQILGFVRDKMREALKKLQTFKEDGDDAEAESTGIFSLIPDADYATNIEIYALWHLGLEIVFTVKKKPKFCWEGLIVVLIGVAEIVAGVALAVLTVGAAANFGMGLIAEGVSDCIDGIIAMATGEFSWAEWGITKAIGLAASLVSGGVARFATKGFTAFKVATKIGKQLKAIPKVAKSTWGLAAKKNFKAVAKLVGKEVVEQGVMRGVAYAEQEILGLVYEKIGDECKKIILGDLKKSFSSGYLAEVVQREFIKQLPDSYALEDKMSPALRKRARKFFEEVGQEVVQTLMADSTIQRHVSEASFALLNRLSEKHEGGKAVYETLELATSAILIGKAVEDVRVLLDKLVPETEKICKNFIEEQSGSAEDITKNSHLQCVIALKNELADYMGDVYAEIITGSLQQNLTFVSNRRVYAGVGKLRHKYLKKLTKGSDIEREVRAGHRANYIRSIDPSDGGPLTSSDRLRIQEYSTRINDVTEAGSILEMKIAAEHYKRGVTIYQEVNGKFIKHSSVDSSSADGEPNIKLLFTPPKDKDGTGHYDLIVDNNKVVKINSEDSNCLFQAYATGRNPKLADSAEGLEKLKNDALKVREDVADEINRNPELWAEHIRHRVEIDKVRRGERFTLLGEAKVNRTTRVPANLHSEYYKGRYRSTTYTADNGVQVKAIREYAANLSVDATTNKINNEPRLESMSVRLDNMNFTNNVGRCYHTLPVPGMPKRAGGKASESCVSFHLGPSEAGANAGSAYANAIMASRDLNKQERDIWKAQITDPADGTTKSVRDVIGDDDFVVVCDVKFEPLVPKKFDDFFKNMNKQRVKHGKPQYPVKHKQYIKDRLKQFEVIDSRACRATEVKYTIYRSDDTTKPIHTTVLERDYELFIPEAYADPNAINHTIGAKADKIDRKNPHQLKGEDLSVGKTKPKVVGGDALYHVPGSQKKSAIPLSTDVKKQKAHHKEALYVKNLVKDIVSGKRKLDSTDL